MPDISGSAPTHTPSQPQELVACFIKVGALTAFLITVPQGLGWLAFFLGTTFDGGSYNAGAAETPQNAAGATTLAASIILPVIAWWFAHPIADKIVTDGSHR